MPAAPNRLPELRAGVYRHYKGHLYLALGYAHDANAEDRIVVHYVPLELDGAKSGPRLATRTALSDDPQVDAWWDFVHLDGTKCNEQSAGKCARGLPSKHRFEYLGTTWHPSV